MTTRQRWIIKIIFISIFAVLAPLVIAYTMGYRYNFSTGQIQKTGVLVINSYPDEAQVYLDGKLIADETPAVIKKINPNFYNVEVIKDGYLPWSKKLEVKSSETTFAESVVLFLDKEPQIMAEREITKSLFSPNRTNLVYVTEESSWAEIWLYSLKKNEFTLIERRDIKNFVNAEFYWSPGSSRIFINVTTPEETEQIIYHVNKNEITNLTEQMEKTFSRFSWSRTSDNIFYFTQGNNLYNYNLQTNRQTFLLGGVREYFIRGNSIYLISKTETSSLVQQFNTLEQFEEGETLYELPLDEYTFEDAGFPYLMLKGTDQKILLFDTSAPFQEPILQESANGYSWHTTSQGEKKLLYYQDFEIWIFYPKSKYNELITRFSSPIQKAIWHRNGEYVFFGFNDSIKVIELDPREKRNIFDLVAGAKINNFIVDYNSKNIYFVGSYDNEEGLHLYQLIEK